jgi:hypothetical protein
MNLLPGGYLGSCCSLHLIIKYLKVLLNRFCTYLTDKTIVFGFDSSNSVVSFVKFQNHLFGPPL